VESRKLQRVGRSTITVSLPNKWVKENGIKPGDIVFIVPDKNGALKIMPSQLFHEGEVEEEYIIDVDACDGSSMLERLIVGSYILGCSVITVVSSNRIHKTHIDTVRRITRKLIGLGIIEENPNSILLQCSLDPAKFKIDMLIRRLSIISSTVLSKAIQALVENDESLIKEAIEHEDEADTIYYLGTRLLLHAQKNFDVAEKLGISDVLLIPAMRLILQALELIGDCSEDIAKKVIAFKVYRDRVSEPILKRLFEFSEAVKTVFQRAIDCFFTGDIKIANSILDMRSALNIEAERLMQELPEIPYLRAMVSGLTNIINIGAICANIAINKAIHEHNKHVRDVVKIIRHIHPRN